MQNGFAVLLREYRMSTAFDLICALGAMVCGLGWLRASFRLSRWGRDLRTREEDSRFIEQERHVLELIAKGASLPEVLSALTIGIEKMAPGCLCSILLLDESRSLRIGAGGSLPNEYMRIVDGLAIGPEVGSCGSAAFRNETIIVSDIASDPKWAPAKDLAAKFGLHACWSVPIRDPNNRVLGTFAMYHRSPISPGTGELAIVRAGAHLAGNAIVRLTAEHKLQETVERLRLAEEVAGFGVWELDAGSKRMTLSEGAAVVSGIPGGATVVDLNELDSRIVAEDRVTVKAATGRALESGQGYEVEFRVEMPDGSIRWCRAHGSVKCEDGRARRIIGSIINITKEKALIEEVRRSAERTRLLAAIVEWAGNAIISLDLHGNVLTWNHGAERIYGFTAEEMTGRTMAMLTPSARAGEDTALMERLCKGEGIDHLETSRLTKANGLIHILLTLSPIRDGEGRVVGAAHVAWDVTHIKQLERQIAHVQKLESIGQLAAGIAHEINTPIQYIGDNARFLQEAFRDVVSYAGAHTAHLPPDDFDYLQNEIPKALEHLLHGVDQVAHIVGAMKEFSHPGPIEKIPVDINRGIESTILVSKNEWKYVAEVTTDLDPELPPVPCLAGDFNQVLLNLIVNAAHAIEEVVGGSGSKGSIRISTRKETGFAEIRVSDNGCGIPKDIQGKIFDPFFTTKPVGKGTGQGLALAHSVIVQKHKGNIRLESEPGRGTTFIIRLPLEHEPSDLPLDRFPQAYKKEFERQPVN
jgi:PAS domain S-box-containing protein